LLFATRWAFGRRDTSPHLLHLLVIISLSVSLANCRIVATASQLTVRSSIAQQLRVSAHARLNFAQFPFSKRPNRRPHAQSANELVVDRFSRVAATGTEDVAAASTMFTECEKVKRVCALKAVDRFNLLPLWTIFCEWLKVRKQRFKRLLDANVVGRLLIFGRGATADVVPHVFGVDFVFTLLIQ
jgi:hypothetical protein